MDLLHESDVTKHPIFIVFVSQLMQLFQRCHGCGLEVKLKTSIQGTLLVLNGVCPDGHILHWQSQPVVRGMAAGNLLLPAAILLCRLTFTSIANLADVFNLAVFCERSFYMLQKQCLCFVAMEKEGLRRCLDKLLNQGVTIIP